MASKAEKAKSMLWFQESTYAAAAQWKFHMVFGRETPTKMIYK
jgi:hypothetical protein